MKHFLYCFPNFMYSNYTVTLCIAGNSTASPKKEIKQRACDTEGEHIETVYLESLYHD